MRDRLTGWTREHARAARIALAALTEQERQQALAGVEASLAVEDLFLTDGHREKLLEYARGALSQEGFDKWLLEALARFRASRSPE